jgi:hypothetical protein
MKTKIMLKSMPPLVYGQQQQFSAPMQPQYECSGFLQNFNPSAPYPRYDDCLNNDYIQTNAGHYLPIGD